MAVLSEVIDALESWYEPGWADSWDAVGLVCGDRAEPVTTVLLAIDAVPSVVDEAIAIGAQLLVTHHPLLLTAVHGVSTDTPKGALVHRMIRAGLAHFVAHTNADSALEGVSDALGRTLGLLELRALDPDLGEPLDKIITFVPIGAVERVIAALAAAGAGRLGDYDRCGFISDGTGTFRPQPGAQPVIGSVGRISEVAEQRIEMVLARRHRADVVAALRSAHPYEEPAYDLFTHASMPSGRGTGRVGHLPESMSLAEFTDRAARTLPATVWGVRAAGDPAQRVQTVAVCGGSGGSLAERARAAGADVFLTADLKHHAVLEAVSECSDKGMALVDAAHWATEAPWLQLLARRLLTRFGSGSLTVAVSDQVTDPWTLHRQSTSSNEGQS